MIALLSPLQGFFFEDKRFEKSNLLRDKDITFIVEPAVIAASFQ
jgi:hypothetical protein